MNKRSFDVVVMSSVLVSLFVIAYMQQKRTISKGIAMVSSLGVIGVAVALTLTVRKNIGKKEPESKPNKPIGNFNPKPKKKKTNNSVFYIIGTMIPTVGLIWYLVSNSKTSGGASRPSANPSGISFESLNPFSKPTSRARPPERTSPLRPHRPTPVAPRRSATGSSPKKGWGLLKNQTILS